MILPASTQAHDGPLRHDYRHAFYDCQRKAGKPACGRHVVREGWKRPRKRATVPTRRQIAESRDRLLRLAMPPPPYLTLTAIGPRGAPAHYGALRRAHRPVGLAACIVHHESRGNSQASNGSHWGIGQWTLEAWGRHGGRRFARGPLGASYQQQLMVLSQGLSRYGCRDWCPFDPC